MNFKTISFWLLLICAQYLSSQGAYGQTLAKFEVEITKQTIGAAIPVYFNLDEVTLLPDSVLNLVELRDGKRIEVDHQLENRGQRFMYWMVSGVQKPQKKIFELRRESPGKPAESMNVAVQDGALTISFKDKDLLRYNFKTMYPPAGVDTVFKRSGFIHPLWTPNGQALTRINARDHYHHFGLWNPWTHVVFEGDTVDFWNLKLKLGTVQFAKFVSVTKGPVYAEFQALHEHVVFKKDGSRVIAMNELQTVRIYEPQDKQDHYIMDITIRLNCAKNSPVLLKEYRYGGLGWRATEKWNRENSETVTSEGKTRKDADGSKARWVLVQGSLDEDFGGSVMMSYPTNYNHPEPLRIWPETANKRGDVYANFSPTRDRDWMLKPGQDYTLKYRFLVFNGHNNKEKAEAAWQAFANPPVIKKILK
ncbi:PmoA family protein [Desertivirga xinjiangensis]|uniref:DUF6807 domain-containing protein n=1 Tax=Desertivirga xinjiangensis TaxID=539206 RepID=UPI00210C4AA1|nr:PmoA family protein [Pedobacter xinjiangensis]